MLGLLPFCIMLLALGLAIPVNAQERSAPAPSINPQSLGEVSARGGETEPRGHLPGRDLLDEIATWLSTQFNLPTIQNLPRVELAPSAKIVALHYRKFRPQTGAYMPAADDAPTPGQRDTVAVYDDDARIIYLPADWTGQTAVEQSILVHEMVHHFQNLLGTKYACPQEREQLAYRAQEDWLAQSGHSLADDFDLDPFSLLITTLCPSLN
jgi:hypothetical protein